jgi:hypothetical protein
MKNKKTTTTKKTTKKKKKKKKTTTTKTKKKKKKKKTTTKKKKQKKKKTTKTTTTTTKPRDRRRPIAATQKARATRAGLHFLLCSLRSRAFVSETVSHRAKLLFRSPLFSRFLSRLVCLRCSRCASFRSSYRTIE